MIILKDKTIDKLLQTKLHTEVHLCSSLCTRVWGFVFITKFKNTMNKLLLSGLCALLLFPLVSFASFDTSLKYGSRGDAVSTLQDFLTDQNVYTGKVDGKFGLGTLKAVKAFQVANNLSADGYFGKGSRAVANTLLAAELQSSNDAEQAETGTVSPVATIDGCTGTTGFSMTTGHPCDGSTTPAPQPVTDAGTQSAITALTQQVQNLTSKLQSQPQQQTVTNPTLPPIIAPTDTTPTVSIPVIPDVTPLFQVKLGYSIMTNNNIVQQSLNSPGQSETMFNISSPLPGAYINELKFTADNSFLKSIRVNGQNASFFNGEAELRNLMIPINSITDLSVLTFYNPIGDGVNPTTAQSTITLEDIRGTFKSNNFNICDSSDCTQQIQPITNTTTIVSNPVSS